MSAGSAGVKGIEGLRVVSLGSILIIWVTSVVEQMGLGLEDMNG